MLEIGSREVTQDNLRDIKSLTQHTLQNLISPREQPEDIPWWEGYVKEET